MTTDKEVIAALMEEHNRLRAALRRIDTAIVYEGRSPQTHRSIMARHRREWPTLWAAIDEARHVLRSPEKSS